MRIYDATGSLREASYYHNTRRGRIIDDLKARGMLPGSDEFAAALWEAEDESYRERQRDIALECGLVLDARTGRMYALGSGHCSNGEKGGTIRVDPATIRNPAVHCRHREDREHAAEACARAGIPVDSGSFEQYRRDWFRAQRTNRNPRPAEPPRRPSLPYPDEED